MSAPLRPPANRTGISAARVAAEETVEGACAGTPAPHFEGQGLAATRFAHSRGAAAVGTVPAPAVPTGAPRSVLESLPARHPPVFLDLLGERLAFERTGTRLYEAFMTKLEAAPSVEAPPHEDLERIRDEELRHVGLLERACQIMGGDPTALTPSADVGAVASRGLINAVTDPRAAPLHGLQAILVLELVDNDGWLVLADLAARLGQDELAAEFRHAMAEEEEHLARVRAWLTAALDVEAGLAPESQLMVEHRVVP